MTSPSLKVHDQSTENPCDLNVTVAVRGCSHLLIWNVILTCFPRTCVTHVTLLQKSLTWQLPPSSGGNYRRAIDVVTIGIVGVGITEDFVSCDLCKMITFLKDFLSIFRSHPSKGHWAFHHHPVLHTRVILFLLSFKILKLKGDFQEPLVSNPIVSFKSLTITFKISEQIINNWYISGEFYIF